MAIADTILSIESNLQSAYTSLAEKGATIPANKNIENLADAISSITGGGGGVETYHIVQTIDGDTSTFAISDYNSAITSDNYLCAIYENGNTQKIYILEEV